MAVKPKVSLVTLGVRDVDRARAFYECLGWTASSDQGKIAFFALEGVVLGLFGWDDLADDAGLPTSHGSVFEGRAWTITSHLRRMSTESSKNSLRLEPLL